MNPKPFFISVIVPVYNGARFLAEAIENILAQNYASLEIVVVDDGSTDETEAIARGLPVRYIHQANAGPAAARNRGLAKARGDVIAFHDVDDLWTPDALKILVAMFRAEPALEIAQGLIQPQVEDATTRRFEDSTEPYQFINLGSALYRRTVFDKVGRFDESLRENEDSDWFMRAWENNVSKQVSRQTVLLYRLHDGNLTHRQNLVRGGWARLFKKHMERRRNGELPKTPAPLADVGQYIGLPPRVKPHKWEGEKFTIISNDCWGGAVYAQLGLMYQSPFVGVRIFAPCYIRLLQNLEQITNGSLEFIDHSRYPFANQQRAASPYPLARLNGSIEIHFVHEPGREEALANWQRRMGRMKWDNLFYKFSEDPWACKREHLEAFERMPFARKVCFTYKPYPELRTTIQIPDFFDPKNDLYLASLERFDVPTWLAQKYGTELPAYVHDQALTAA